jgi:hypothetical protein
MTTVTLTSGRGTRTIDKPETLKSGYNAMTFRIRLAYWLSILSEVLMMNEFFVILVKRVGSNCEKSANIDKIDVGKTCRRLVQGFL